MPIAIELGIGLLLPKALPQGYSRTDVLFAIAERAQRLSLVDVELCDWLEQGEARAWGEPEDPTWYQVQMPDVMGPVAPPPRDIRSRWRSLQPRPGLSVSYARGAVCLPGTQRAGALEGFGDLDFLDGLWAMPLGALRELVLGDERAIEQLIEECATARVPVCMSPQQS